MGTKVVRDVAGAVDLKQLFEGSDSAGWSPVVRTAPSSSGAGKGTPTASRVQPTNTSGTALAANTGRIAALFQNVGTVDVYLYPGGSATTTNGIVLPASTSVSFEDRLTTAAWHAITASGTGDLRIVEVA